MPSEIRRDDPLDNIYPMYKSVSKIVHKSRHQGFPHIIIIKDSSSHERSNNGGKKSEEPEVRVSREEVEGNGGDDEVDQGGIENPGEPERLLPGPVFPDRRLRPLDLGVEILQLLLVFRLMAKQEEARRRSKKKKEEDMRE